MQTPLEVTEKYFEASNRSDFFEIEKLLTEETTYSSANTGLHLGKSEILEMQKVFHNSFSKLHWTVDSLEEEKSGVVRVDFTFSASKPDGDEISTKGTEYVLVSNGKIHHIEIRKP